MEYYNQANFVSTHRTAANKMMRASKSTSVVPIRELYILYGIKKTSHTKIIITALGKYV